MAGAAGLKRLAKLYGMVETLHAMRVKAASGAVDEVERVTERLGVARRDEVSLAQAALERGSRVESMAAERTAAAGEVRRMLLARMRVERTVVYEAEVEAHRVSRLELRQIDGIVVRTQKKEQAKEERRAQEISDDRYLSRREWMRAKETRERG